jgi:hypothetical protein
MAGFAKAGPGRPKGSKNKTTQSAKDAIAQAAEGLGGAERLQQWATEAPENEKTFWGTIYPKLLPLAGTKDNPFAGTLKFITATKPRE